MKISNQNQIQAYLHCVKCLDEIPDGVSPQEYAMTQAGWTPQGMQVWCNRHNCNVVHMDFEGNTHPANTSIPDRPVLTVV